MPSPSRAIRARLSIAGLCAGLAGLTAAEVSLADDRVVEIENRDSVPQTIEYAVGPSADCNSNKAFVGKQTMPPKSVYSLRIKGEPFACIRRPGGTWRAEDLRGKKGKVRLRIDDPNQ
jgi:hypothetical protein